MEEFFAQIVFPIFVMLSAHCIGDFPMQGEYLAVGKSKSNYLLWVHCLIYTAFIGIGVYVLHASGGWFQGMTISYFSLVMIIVFLFHVMIDKAKCVFQTELNRVYGIGKLVKNVEEGKILQKGLRLSSMLFAVDQFLHILIVFGLVFFC